jgi:hypothetical protein
MNTTQLILLVIACLIAIAVVWGIVRSRRTTKLRSRFGPEYDVAVQQYGNRTRAEHALDERSERAASYRIRPIAANEQARYLEMWHHTQARFVNDPSLAVREADSLVCEVMRARGYPTTDFEQRAQDLSVDHPQFVKNYRDAHAIAVLEQQNRATTEDLRRAMICYRDLFDELLETAPAAPR